MNPTSVKKTLVLLVKTRGPPSSFPHPVCPLHTSPCVRSIRPRVCRHHAHMFQHMWAWCRYTRGRFGRTHGDVLSGHTGFFSSPHHTTHRTHHNTRHNTPQQHDRNNTRRQRHAETENEDREDKTTEERREKIDFQCGGARPFC